MKIKEGELDELIKHQAELRYAAAMTQKAAEGAGIKQMHKNQFTTMSKILDKDEKILRREIKHSNMAKQIGGEIKVADRVLKSMSEARYRDIAEDCEALVLAAEVLSREFQIIKDAVYGKVEIPV